jgi:hypothetical protein
VPLDAHGNPISEDSLGVEDAHDLHVIADEERQPLAANIEPEDQVSCEVTHDMESEELTCRTGAVSKWR